MKKLNPFHTTCMRKILSITWRNHIPDTKVLVWASLSKIYTILTQSEKDHRLPKKPLYGELYQNKHFYGGQKKCFKDTLKVSMKSFGITSNSQEYLVQDRDKWQENVRHGVKAGEARRNVATEQCKKLKKGTATTIPCSHSPRLSHAQIGHISHPRTHRSCLQSYVDQKFLIDYDGQRRYIYICMWSEIDNLPS